MALKAGSRYRIIINIFVATFAAYVLVNRSIAPSGIPSPTFIATILDGLVKLGVPIPTFHHRDENEANSVPIDNLGDSPHYLYLSNIIKNTKDFGRNVYLLIVVESLGWTDDKSINQFLQTSWSRMFERLRDHDHRFSITKTRSDFTIGGTFAAEMRYLCDLKSPTHIHRFYPVNVDSRPAIQKCIPWKFKAHDFLSVYFHDGRRKFYNRYRVLPSIGFQRLHFQNESKTTLQKCMEKAFCGDDKEQFSAALDLFRDYNQSNLKNEDLFVSMMTIDTHGPYKGGSSLIDSYRLAASRSIDDIGNFLLEASSTLKNSSFRVLLLPDHAPPLPVKGVGVDMNYRRSHPNIYSYYIHRCARC